MNDMDQEYLDSGDQHIDPAFPAPASGGTEDHTPQSYHGTMLSDSVIKTVQAYGRIFKAIKGSQ